MQKFKISGVLELYHHKSDSYPFWIKDKEDGESLVLTLEDAKKVIFHLQSLINREEYELSRMRSEQPERVEKDL